MYQVLDHSDKLQSWIKLIFKNLKAEKQGLLKLKKQSQLIIILLNKSKNLMRKIKKVTKILEKIS